MSTPQITSVITPDFTDRSIDYSVILNADVAQASSVYPLENLPRRDGISSISNCWQVSHGDLTTLSGAFKDGSGAGMTAIHLSNGDTMTYTTSNRLREQHPTKLVRA